MAQETGIFSVRRPRETLGGINPNASSIPMPSSAMKRSNSVSNLQVPHTTNKPTHARSISGSRMSLAPGRPNQPVFQRSSSGSNLAEMGSSAQRNSTMFNSGGRKSIAPVNATPAPSTSLQLQQSTQRRSSVYSARHSASMGQIGHQSFFATGPTPAGVPRDPRPLKDRQYLTQIGTELMDYLTHNNFEMEMKHSLTQRTMISPTQKDFNLMFQWLYHRIDPSYRFMKSVEAEVPPILKQLRYPFEKNITKSQLTAVGGQNCWHTFLGMLHWLMQLARMMDQYNAGNYDDACIEAGFDVSADRIVFDFLSDAYHTWLTMDEEQEERADELMKKHVDAMAAKFDEGNARYLEQIKILEAEHRSLQDQINELGKNDSQIEELEGHVKILEDDRRKFEQYNSDLRGKVEAREERSKRVEEEIQKTDVELQEVEREKASLRDAVDQKGISIQDIDHMNSERERMQKGLEAAAVRLEEVKKKLSEKEIEANQKLELLERTAQEYNSLGYQIGVIPSTATNAKGHNYELSLHINADPDFSSSRQKRSELPQPDRLLADQASGYQPQSLLSLDMKGTAKNNLVALRKEISERKNGAAEADLEKKDLLDKIKEAIEDKQQEVEGLNHRVRAAEDEFERTRDINNAQKMASDAQIEKLEKELARMRTTMTESVQLMEQREMNTNVEYEQLTLRAAALREELHTEIERMLNDIIRFKVHIQKGLEDYENFVGEEVENELNESEEAEEAQENVQEQENVEQES